MSDSVVAKHGEKMIEIKVRLWTNDIAPGAGEVVPRHAWTAGVVRMEANETHAIKPLAPKPFRSLLHLPFVIEQVLTAHGIVLHASEQTKKYTAAND